MASISQALRDYLRIAITKRSVADELSDKIDLLDQYIPQEVADPGTGKAIPVTRSAVINIVTAGAETNTLAIPTFLGQQLILNCSVFVGNRVITASQGINQAGNTIMTFGAVRDSIVLEAVKVGSALRWCVTGNDGVALS
jgi:hypothetical protein